MKILFLTEIFPYPLDSGGKIVSYQMLKMLSENHKLYLVAIAESRPTRGAMRAITSLGIKTDIVISKKRNPWYKQSKKELLWAMMRLKPTIFTPFWDTNMSKKIKTLLHNNKFDAIHIDHLSMTQYLPKEKNALWILHEHNLEFKLFDEFSRAPQHIKEKLFNLYNAWALQRYETNILRQIDQIILLSQEDKKNLMALGVPSKKMVVIPPHISDQKPQFKSNKRQNELLFIGNAWWKPNEDAITWFIHDILPIIHQTKPDVRLTVIGEGINRLGDYSHQNIQLLEKQADITPYLLRANVFVLPFRMGQGVRIKALMALAYGLPIVATSVGMRGLETRPGKEFLLADTPSAFARQTAALLTDRKLQKTLVSNGRMYIQKNHNPALIKKYFLEHYARLSISD